MNEFITLLMSKGFFIEIYNRFNDPKDVVMEAVLGNPGHRYIGSGSSLEEAMEDLKMILTKENYLPLD